MNMFLLIFLGIILALMVTSMVLFWKFNLKKRNEKEETTLKGIKEFSPLIIAYVGIIVTVIPYFISEEKIPVFFPEYEDKISEIDQLKKENSELKTTIADQTQEQNKLSEKNKDLSEKNYAELTKISLVVDGLPVTDGNYTIADVNDTLYYNEDILKKFANKDLSYDEDSKTVYIGSKVEQKVTNRALSE